MSILISDTFKNVACIRDLHWGNGYLEYKWNRDCREYRGKFACDSIRYENYASCEDCKFYDKIGKRVLIIKLGAMGDVLRTTPLLKTIKKKYPNCHVSWLVFGESKDFLNSSRIDRVLEYNFENVLRLLQEKFDVLISLEIDAPGTVVASYVKANYKFGYYLDSDGHTNCFNESAHYYFERVLSDKINKANRKTYQEMMAEIAELEYNKEDYDFRFNAEQGKYVLINIGADERWPCKSWHKDKIIELVCKLNEKDEQVMLCGGPKEKDLLPKIVFELNSKNVDVLTNDCENSLKDFFNVVNGAKAVVTGDTMCLHLAGALKKKTVGLFFVTPDWEVEDYGRIKKLKSDLLEKFWYTDEYSEELVNSISVDDVLNAINELKNEN